MAEDNGVTETREELKRQLAAGEYRSSIDVILDAVGRILQKLTRRAAQPAAWISALVIALLVSLIATFSALLTGGASQSAYRTIAFAGVLLFLNLMLARSTFRRTFEAVQKKLLDGLKSDTGLTGLRDWLVSARDLKRPALTGLLIFVAFAAFIFPNPIENPGPLELAVVGGVMLVWTGFLLYFMYLFVVLPLRLGRCRFKLHAEDPASTEVLSDWSAMMNYAAYMFAFMLAAGTLFTVTMETFSTRALFFVIPRWLPLIALFVVNQVAISKVITRSKRASLNRVEAQMAALRPMADPPDNETLETVLWLWDYHDRIKDTRNSSLNFKGILNLVNTLLIPLLAWLIANRESILELLGR